MPPAVSKPDKITLRKQFRAARRGIDAAARRRCDDLINAVIESWVRHHGYQRIAGYRAFDGEVDIAPALKALDASGVSVFLPVIHPDSEVPRLSFRQWSANAADKPGFELDRNAFGIEEPTTGADGVVADLDVVFLPGVAWDRKGARLGMGAGYYDRALAPVARDRRPLRIGVAYDVQRADEIPVNDHDIPLHGMVTESGLFTFAG